MITKAAYIEKRGTSLMALDVEIARLTDFADGATAKVSGQYYRKINGLLTIRDRAAEKLRDLSTDNDQEWAARESTVGVENTWLELRQAVLATIAMLSCEKTGRSR